MWACSPCLRGWDVNSHCLKCVERYYTLKRGKKTNTNCDKLFSWEKPCHYSKLIHVWVNFEGYLIEALLLRHESKVVSISYNSVWSQRQWENKGSYDESVADREDERWRKRKSWARKRKPRVRGRSCEEKRECHYPILVAGSSKGRYIA